MTTKTATKQKPRTAPQKTKNLSDAVETEGARDQFDAFEQWARGAGFSTLQDAQKDDYLDRATQNALLGWDAAFSKISHEISQPSRPTPQVEGNVTVDLTWKQENVGLLDNYYTDTPIGRFTLTRDHFKPVYVLKTPFVNGEMKHIKVSGTREASIRVSEYVEDLMETLKGMMTDAE